MSQEKTMNKILSLASSAFGVTIDDLRSKSRFRETCDARKAIVYILKEDLGTGPGHIAKSINKDHCGMGYMHRQAELLMKSDQGFKMRVNRIRMEAGLTTTCPCCGRLYEAT